jgi:hypothetical protein
MTLRGGHAYSRSRGAIVVTGAITVAALCLTIGLVRASHAARPKPPAAPSELTVGDRSRPLNVEGAPQFGWMPSSSRGDDFQTAYQITVSQGGDTVWDSGKVESSDQSYVPYGGPALQPGTSYEWSVRTWDSDGTASAWARAAHFDTGLADGDWSGAAWIRRVTTGNDFTDDYTLARRQVTIGASPWSARAHTSPRSGSTSCT